MKSLETTIRSLIILTLKFDSVAEIAEMPLYRVTCGDIGTTTEAVEKYLETILHLGKTWNCGTHFPTLIDWH